MFNVSAESMDHLVLHCSVLMIVGPIIFLAAFGVYWLMPQGVLDIYLCLKVFYVKYSNSIMWIVWRKKKNSTSEGMERSVIEIYLYKKKRSVIEISSNFLHLF